MVPSVVAGATCDGETLSWTLTVYPADGQPAGHPGDNPGKPNRQVTRTPRRAPDTGGGAPADHPALLLGAAGLAGLGTVAARRVRH